MSIRTHRIKEIIYAENAMTIRACTPLFEAIEAHSDTNDFRNYDGGGIIETTVSALKEILKYAKDYGLSNEEKKELKNELAEIKKEGKKNDDYILFDMF